MPRKKSAAYMSAGEQIAGTVLFVIYLPILEEIYAASQLTFFGGEDNERE